MTARHQLVLITLAICATIFLAPSSLDSVPHRQGGLIASGEINRIYIPPPESVRPGLARRTANIVVNYNPGSCPSGVTTAWSSEAQAAFEYAVSIWAAILNSDLTIEIDACWRNDMASNVLGSAGPARYFQDFTDAPQASTWYAVALANEYNGSDLNGGTAEINANFNSSFGWYFGTDGNPSNFQYDFVSTVLHEIAHGLGFAGSMNFDDGVSPNECGGSAGTGCYGAGTVDPFIYDQFTENDAGTSLIAYTNPSTGLGNQITSNDVFFDGTSANILNGGTRVELYAPSLWNPGSSYSHLGQNFNGTDNALMTFSADFGEAIHHPGIVALGLLIDIGWDIRNLATVWVDVTYSGEEIGGPTNPFNTVAEGTKAVEPNGTVLIRPGTYDEELTIIRAMLIRPEGGDAVIGQ